MKHILVVVDMQKDFVDGALGTPEAMAIVPAVADKIAAYAADPDGVIFITYDTHEVDYLHTSEGKHLPVPHCLRQTDGWQLDARIEEALTGVMYSRVEKPTFGSIALPTLIRAMTDIDGDNFSVELCGLCTDICVVSNALLLKAHFPDIAISVDASACAGVTPATHEAALTTMSMCQIEITGRS